MIERDGIAVTECTLCSDLVDSRSQIVNGRGDPEADLVLVGEAPGRVEDVEGVPFVGRSGEILEDLLADLGVSSEAVRITNCVRCRPPDNRDPRVEHRRNCRGHLDYEIGQIDPTVLLTLGRVSATELLGESIAVTEQAGEIHEIDIAGERRQLVIGLHPAATLYDRSTRPTFEVALERAIELADL